MKLEVGKTYLTRNNKEVTVVEYNETANFPYRGSLGSTYLEDGCAYIGTETEHDLIKEKPTTSYDTKPINYEGCNSVIADHLKQGLSILCEVWDEPSTKRTRHVIAYSSKAYYKYFTETSVYTYAVPVEIKQRKLIPPERAIPILIENGYTFEENGGMINKDTQRIIPEMLLLLGLPMHDSRVQCWQWPDCIVEEL